MYEDDETGCEGCGGLNGNHFGGCSVLRELEEVARRIQPEERRICRDCGGTNTNRINPNDGGGCPSCIGGYEM